ncbi:PREDICTED: NSFL1 cofactor p47-like [Priapulus caudatus]|uniref:NSFL1 cofactor p47-like n=1 Tax=Priapulus caudatus TaxID=37621 RepID=A0ABM1DV66_PRICU|nr:PREDICTED: NSFL1 cofactor p47-like [Priapulus caudatus]
MADNNNHEQLISQFIGVTGVDNARAMFYLESSGWQLEVAMASFYDNDHGAYDDSSSPILVEDDDPPPVPVRDQSSLAAVGPTSKPTKSQPSRFSTLSDLQREEQPSDDEEGQEFYAGGSEKGGSGEVVIGPGRKKKKSDAIVQGIFQAAKEHGAEVVDEEESPSRRHKTSFQGAGYRLGSEDGSSSSQQVQAATPAVPKERQVEVVLKLWKDGFSVNDGNLRDYNDPENKDFLDSIHRGEIPLELIRLAPGGEVNLNMEDHRHEDYVQPKRSVRAFQGAGHMLGSPVPNVVTATHQQPSSAEKKQADQPKAAVGVKLDTSQPVTSLQIRLADGSRLVQKFNHTHTVGDIRLFINSARPEMAMSAYVLQTTFPNKELAEPSVTLAAAGLLNAVIVQRKVV